MNILGLISQLIGIKTLRLTGPTPGKARSTTSQMVHLPPIQKGEIIKTNKPPGEGLDRDDRGIRKGRMLTVAKSRLPHIGDSTGIEKLDSCIVGSNCVALHF